jgi:hypothetical protein
MKNFVAYEPVRVLSALLAFGIALITLLALQLVWDPEVIVAVNGTWGAFIALLGSFWTRSKVTPI